MPHVPHRQRGEHITLDQYEPVLDDKQRERLGTRTYARMASWPVAFEEAIEDAMARPQFKCEYRGLRRPAEGDRPVGSRSLHGGHQNGYFVV